mmetsp:Transcript_26660/g.74632  ORF Transcript_26660/g.74632 Transcript_26660/m.74632 type:complete len:417 (+) Transcript_26660:1-1251(+)
MNPHSKNHRLPPLFYLMEVGDWERAAERAKKHPREVTSWASLRTKYTAPHKISSAKRLALHHACFKLRSAVNTTVSADGSTEDPFLQVCRFILTLVELYPDAASMRESRHGCLPLHLAAFASCTRPSSSSSSSSSSSASSSPSSTRQAQQLEASLFSPSSFSSTSMASAATAIHKNMASSLQSPSTVASSRSPSSAAANQAGCSAFPFSLARPANVARDRRSVSESTSDTIHSNMTNMMEQEYMSGSQQQNYNGSGSGHSNFDDDDDDEHEYYNAPPSPPVSCNEMLADTQALAWGVLSNCLRIVASIMADKKGNCESCPDEEAVAAKTKKYKDAAEDAMRAASFRKTVEGGCDHQADDDDDDDAECCGRLLRGRCCLRLRPLLPPRNELPLLLSSPLSSFVPAAVVKFNKSSEAE